MGNKQKNTFGAENKFSSLIKTDSFIVSFVLVFFAASLFLITFNFDKVPPILNRGMQPATFPKILLLIIIFLTFSYGNQNFNRTSQEVINLDQCNLQTNDLRDENELLKILNPLMNSKTVWKTHALYLIAEYYYSKNEKIKSKEFFNKILTSESTNQDIIKKAQKRLNRDLSE